MCPRMVWNTDLARYIVTTCYIYYNYVIGLNNVFILIYIKCPLDSRQIQTEFGV